MSETVWMILSVIGAVGILAGLVGIGVCLWLLFRKTGYEDSRLRGNDMVRDLIRNGDMELPYQQHDGTTIVAENWMPFLSAAQSELGDQVCQKPEFKPIPRSLAPYRVVSGDTAQCWFIRWKLMDGGVYQEVQVPVGATLTFSAQVQCWCSQSNDPRTDDGEFYFQLGIDRSGGINAWGPEVVWSGWRRGTKEYQRLELQAVATAAWVTVFVRAANKWTMSHNDAYVDDVRLEIEGGGAEPGPGITREELAQAYRQFADELEGG